MREFVPKSLEEVVAMLRSISGETVRGVDDEIFSYRGYYSRSAVAFDPSREMKAEELADRLENQFGKDTSGWKYGLFNVDPKERLYVVNDRSTWRGATLAGFEKNASDGVYEPILLMEFQYGRN